METHELCRIIANAVGIKRWAGAIGRTRNHLYSWLRDPSDPDADASPNLFDWVEATVDLLASRPGGRPALIALRHWFCALIDRALSAWKPEPLTPDALAQRTSTTLREFADFVAAASPSDFDPAVLAREGAEAIEAIETLVRAASGGLTK